MGALPSPSFVARPSDGDGSFTPPMDKPIYAAHCDEFVIAYITVLVSLPSGARHARGKVESGLTLACIKASTSEVSVRPAHISIMSDQGASSDVYLLPRDKRELDRCVTGKP